jgi:hypothetical protein
MDNSHRQPDSGETARSLTIVTGIALFFLVWGLTIFFVVGDKGPPSWDFGTVQDIPGESPYSTHVIREVAELNPLPVESGVVVDRQHVDEPPREAGELKVKKP